jgi:hypothetical protein
MSSLLNPPPLRQHQAGLIAGRLPSWFPPLFYLVLACLFLWRSTFAGEVFLPAGLLGHIAPYSARIHSDALPPWNPLRWDGIAQFYPWRHFAAATVHSGTLPLWNPYQFCGTPFVANSQSAVFYPGNLLFYLLPTVWAFGYSVVLHLTLAGWFLYLLLRRLRCTQIAALTGGAIYAYSAWQVSWLQLPTFLATSCWIPLLLRQVLEIGKREEGKGKSGRSLFSLFPLPFSLAMMLLAGHLQIAFYGLLAGTLLALTLLVTRGKGSGWPYAGRMLAAYLAGLALGLMLAAPQLLPAIELSGRSHRVGKPTAAGYAAYTEPSLPPQNLITLLLPEFYGADTDTDNPYWGFYLKSTDNGERFAIRHNAAETALYVGIAPLLLTGLALKRGRRDPKTLFFAVVAAFSLLLALGTPLNALFYFGVPGFGQSGSPARVLVLWALAIAVLAAFGLDRLSERPASRRELAGMAGGAAFLLAIGLSFAAQALSRQLTGFSDLKVPLLGDALGRIGISWLRLLAATFSTLLLCMVSGREIRLRPISPFPFSLFPLLVILDLFSAGVRSNPTAPRNWVYPETAGIRFLQAHLGHERVFPVNRRWSMIKAPGAVLPPNGAMVYGLRDVQGYDSLLTGRYKAFADQFARLNSVGARNASPAEDGNIVFFQDPNAPLVPLTGAMFALTLSPSAPEYRATEPPSGNEVYDNPDEMVVYALSNAQPRARLLAADSTLITNGRVTYIEDEPTRVTLEIETLSPATLLLADQNYPGWQAHLDGGMVQIMAAPLPSPAADLFRAISVPAGRHRVVFRYLPAGFRLGVYLACLALFLSIIGAICPLSRNPSA